jgi:hypothetical protein
MNPMKSRYLTFDLETAKVQLRGEKDWKAKRPLGISCAATFLSTTEKPLLWYGMTKTKRPSRRMRQEEAMALVDYLASQVKQGYTIVTWNGVGFDFDILAEESGMLEECRRLALTHVDMMFHVLCQRGFGVSLASAAKAMNIESKSRKVDGTTVPRLWAEGRREEVLQYVAHDAWMTMQILKICQEQGCFCWITRGGRRRKMPLRRGWLAVTAAQRLRKPSSTWMCKSWSRSEWTAWLR